jgi:hypothetical protein
MAIHDWSHRLHMVKRKSRISSAITFAVAHDAKGWVVSVSD